MKVYKMLRLDQSFDDLFASVASGSDEEDVFERERHCVGAKNWEMVNNYIALIRIWTQPVRKQEGEQAL